MDNNRANQPKGILSPWTLAEKGLEKLDEAKKKELSDSHKNITFESLTRDATRDERNTWNLTMSLPYDLSSQIIEKAKYMPSDRVKDLLMLHYDLDDEETRLFEKLVAFGAALGISSILAKLYDDASSGEDKGLANRMKYIEIMTANGGDKDKSAVVQIILNEDGIESEGYTHEGKNVSIGGNGDTKNNVVDFEPKS